jgi:hypothetical protein
MRVDVGSVRVNAGSVNTTDAWEAIRRHCDGDWGHASPNEAFNNEQNALWRTDEVISRHVDRNGVRFCVLTDFAQGTTTVLVEGGR